MATLVLLTVFVSVAGLYLLFRAASQTTQGHRTPESNDESSRAIDQHTHDQNVAEFNSMLGNLFQAMEFSCVRQQIVKAIEGKTIPEGGIIDSHIRGYFLGFVESYLIAHGIAGIDANPSATTDAFIALSGDPSGSSESGISMLNECLKERSIANNAGSNSPFERGFTSGSTDHNKWRAGQTPQRLFSYISDRLL